MKSYLLLGGAAVMMMSCAATPPSADTGDPDGLPPASAPANPAPSVPETPTPSVPESRPATPQPAPTAATRSVWDGVYSLAQAERGQRVAQEQCAICHSAQGEWALLFGLWSGRALLEPFTTIRMTMPQHNPGGLQRSEYAAVMAYILQLNGAPAGSSDLPSDDAALGRIMVTQR